MGQPAIKHVPAQGDPLFGMGIDIFLGILSSIRAVVLLGYVPQRDCHHLKYFRGRTVVLKGLVVGHDF